MNTESFQAFIEVYQHKSFAEVAKKRNVAPSSITRTISQLESELGFKLFQRTTRKVSITEKGREFYQRILPIQEELSAIKDQMSEEQIAGVLRLTANTSFSFLFLNKWITKFKKQYPDIKIELIVNDKNIDIINERVDLAIRFGKLADSSFVGSKLFDLDYVVCCSPKYLGKKRITKPVDLESEKQVSFLLERYSQAWKFRKKGKEQDISIDPQIKVTGALSLIQFVKKGMGFGVVPKQLIQNELKRKELVIVLSSYEVTPTDFGAAAWILYPSKEFVPRKVKAFIEFVKEESNK